MHDHILVVDDEESIRQSLQITFKGEGFHVTTCGTGQEGLQAIEETTPDAVFLDVQLPDIDGLEILRRVRETHATLPVVMISGHATIERAVEATRLGAFDFVEKPFSRERLLLLARNATEAGRLKREVGKLKAGDFGEILGESESVQTLRETIARVADTDVRVLILGPSGTGKELVARALHDGGRRRDKPFIRVNCAAIPEELIESELFGAVKGAYTGATSAREGRFAAADGGTLFLDEIGDMSANAQAKVLRVLQEGEYEPVGSTKVVKVDVRVISATHQDLAARVQDGRFREDLLYRINVLPIEVPALRDRKGDASFLGRHFLASYVERHELPAPILSNDAWSALDRHAWPGNIRELKNVMERLVILHAGRTVTSSELNLGLASSSNAAGHSSSQGDSHAIYQSLPLKEAKDLLERNLISAALEEYEGNVTRAASSLGLERTHLHKRIRSLGLKGEGE